MGFGCLGWFSNEPSIPGARIEDARAQGRGRKLWATQRGAYASSAPPPPCRAGPWLTPSPWLPPIRGWRPAHGRRRPHGWRGCYGWRRSGWSAALGGLASPPLGSFSAGRVGEARGGRAAAPRSPRHHTSDALPAIGVSPSSRPLGGAGRSSWCSCCVCSWGCPAWLQRRGPDKSRPPSSGLPRTPTGKIRILPSWLW